MEKHNNNWNIKKLVNMVTKGELNFDLSIQRNRVWDEKTESLLIDSILRKYPIPAVFMTKENSIYDVLDGKQRLLTFARFLNNEFALQGLNSIEVDGEEYELNEKTFELLNDELQNNINGYGITIYYLEDATEEEVNEVFVRLNNGMPLTKFEMTRVLASQLMPTIKRITEHEAFSKFAISEKQLTRYTDQEIVLQMLITLFTEKPSFVGKDMQAWAEQFIITAEQEKQVMDILDIFNYIHQMGHTKAVKKAFKKTHIATLTYLINKYGRDDMSNYVYFVNEFFAGRSVKSDDYASACRGGTAKPEKIKRRFEEADKYFQGMKGVVTEQQQEIASTDDEENEEVSA